MCEPCYIAVHGASTAATVHAPAGEWSAVLSSSQITTIVMMPRISAFQQYEVEDFLTSPEYVCKFA